MRFPSLARLGLRIVAVAEGFFALVGVIMGGGIAETSTALRARRTNSREAKAAARLVAEDFFAYRTAIDTALAIDNWAALARNPAISLDNWREHGAVLAASLSRQEWRLLRITARRLVFIDSVARRSTGALSADSRDKCTSAASYAEACYTLLRERPSADAVRAGLDLREPAVGTSDGDE